MHNMTGALEKKSFRSLFDVAADAMLVADRESRIVLANPAAERLFGYTLAELSAHAVDDLVPPRFRARHHSLYAGFFDHPHQRFMGGGLEVYGLRKDGTEFPADVSLSPIEPGFVLATVRDITVLKHHEAELEHHRRRLEELVAKRTAQLEKQAGLLKDANSHLVTQIEERQRAEQALRESEARFRQLLESAGEGIYGLDTQGRCTFVNDAALEMLGYARAELLGHDTHPLIHHSYADGTPYPIENCRIYDAFRNGQPCRGTVEVLWRKDGSSFTAEYSSFPLRDEGRVTGAVLVFRDVTEAQTLAQQLSYQATHDALTGLVNRQEFERRLERVLDEARQKGGEHALLYLDLDRFKVVNDSCGHTAGDQLLRQLSDRLQARMRARDTLARLGGDEFGVLLEHCPMDQALRIAAGLCDAVNDFRFDWEDRSFTVGASVGLAPLTASTESAKTAMRAADAACYAAKKSGRNRVQVADS